MVIDGYNLTDPRLELIRDVVRIFPSLPVVVNSDMSVSEFYQSYPDLQGKLGHVVQSHNTSIQDAFEFFYKGDGSLNVLNTQYYSDGDVLSFFPGSNVINLNSKTDVPAGRHWRSSIERNLRYAGGNIEFLLDGTPLLGKNIPKGVYEWFKTNSGKEPLLVESAWNSSGDLDEIFLMTTDPLNKNSCILFYSDLVAGSDLAVQGITYFKENGIWNNIPERTREFLILTSRHDPLLDETQQIIKRDLQTILSHSSMTNCRAVGVPQVYAESSYNGIPPYAIEAGFKPQMYALAGNQVNSLVIQNHIFYLESGSLIQEAAAKSIFEENGFTVHSYSAAGFDGGGGSMHCSTNTIRGKM